MDLIPEHLINFEIDLQMVIYHLFQLGLAFLFALPIGLNRESSSNGAGLRTFPLVALASCAFMLIAMNAYSAGDGEAEARVMYGIITGIGFIGGGAIFKQNDGASGTATAAGIWNTGAIGIAVAYQNYEIALILSILNFCIFQFSRQIKPKKVKELAD
ncbi:MgtC/SapB family protein [Paraglaciecola polaris]|uniref:Protein MgtC n=1 Tax=Paraglaciecola polaris LMG 21857 TaxID=1129793 RepID=K6YQL4_9ALTE|nr:MgtC/SapB family protein [Paraglaciecola polaris]GAC35029.1 protein srpB [Paraglaciecola polaris LMG 21857]|tara:strand:- start:12742 stop:13215 length:474 start_codon:yes stop_codon:yes gene_type:complete